MHKSRGDPGKNRSPVPLFVVKGDLIETSPQISHKHREKHISVFTDMRISVTEMC